MTIRSQSVSEELAATFRSEADTLLTLSQIEANLDDAFHKAVQELQRLQAIRKEREAKARKARDKTA